MSWNAPEEGFASLAPTKPVPAPITGGSRGGGARGASGGTKVGAAVGEGGEDVSEMGVREIAALGLEIRVVMACEWVIGGAAGRVPMLVLRVGISPRLNLGRREEFGFSGARSASRRRTGVMTSAVDTRPLEPTGRLTHSSRTVTAKPAPARTPLIGMGAAYCGGMTRSPPNLMNKPWSITTNAVGPAGLKDLVNDFVVKIEGAKSGPIDARRLETLEALRLGGIGKLADHMATTALDRGPEVATDGLITPAEVRELAKTEAFTTGLGSKVNLKLLESLVTRPKAQPLGLEPAERIITRREAYLYPSSPEVGREAGLEQLGPTHRAMARRVLETLDRHTSGTTETEFHEHALAGVINEALLDRFRGLSDLELSAYEPDGPKVGAAGQRAVAEKLRKHLQEHDTRELEPRNPRPVVNRFPVEAIKLRLETDPVPDAVRSGRLSLNQLNRALVVDVPPGYTAVLNVQSRSKPSPGSDTLQMAEYVIPPTAKDEPAELARVPGIDRGAPAEVWVVVMKGREVVSNQSFLVPENPITERIRTERI